MRMAKLLLEGLLQNGVVADRFPIAQIKKSTDLKIPNILLIMGIVFWILNYGNKRPQERQVKITQS